MAELDNYKEIRDKFGASAQSKPYKFCEVDFSVDDFGDVEPFSKPSKLQKYIYENNLENTTTTFSLCFLNKGISVYAGTSMEPMLSIGMGTLDEIPDYNAIVNQMLNRPEKVIFGGSLDYVDFMKVYEIKARSRRCLLDDEQFNALYKKIITFDDSITSYLNRTDWLKSAIEKAKSKVSDIKVEYWTSWLDQSEYKILEENSLLDENRIEKQLIIANREIEEDWGDFILKQELPYLNEFFLACEDMNGTLKHADRRKPVKLIRDTLLNEYHGLRKGKESLFTDMFDEYSPDDLRITF